MAELQVFDHSPDMDALLTALDDDGGAIVENLIPPDAVAAIIDDLASALAASPRGEVVNRPLWRVVWDPDFFGGEEDRAPWADTVTTHP